MIKKRSDLGFAAISPTGPMDHASTIAVIEPSGGSDLFGIGTTAKKEGEHYILNGRKCFITNAHISDIHMVLAKTGEGSKRYLST